MNFTTPLKVIFILVSFISFTALSLSPVTLSENQGRYFMGHYLEVLEDVDKKFTIDQISSPSFNDRFQRTSKKLLNFGNTSSAIWIRATINNNSSTKRWLLECSHTVIDRIDLYNPLPDGGFSLQTEGDFFPFSEREFKHTNFVFSLDIQKDEQKVIYLRFEAVNTLIIPLTLWKPDSFYKNSQIVSLSFGLYFGILLVLMIYNAFIYLSEKDIAYLYYVLYTLTFFAFMSVYIGLADQFIWPNRSIGNRLLVPLSSTYVIFGILFTQSFLKTKIKTPKDHELLQGVIAISIFYSILFLIFNNSFTISFAFVSHLFFAFIPLYIGIKSWIDGYKSARYYVLAWSVLLLGMMAFYITNLGLVDYNYVSLIVPAIVSSMEMIFLSFALADREHFFQKKVEGDLRLTASELTKNVEEQEVKSNFSNYAMDNAADMIFWVNSNLSIHYANKLAAKKLNYHQNDIVGLMCKDIINSMHKLGKFSEERIPAEGIVFETEFKTKEGIVFPVDIIAQTILCEGEVRIIAFARDITSRRVMEKEIINAKDTAEELKIEAVNANSAKTKFLATMSHEIRTPMNAILGFTELMIKSTGPSKEQKKWLNLINNSGIHLLDIVNDILDISKIEAGQINLVKKDFSLRKMLKNIEQILILPCQNKNLNFICNLNEDVPDLIHADRGKLSQILINLLGNAVKFTQNGYVAVSVHFNDLGDGDLEFMIEVEDNGIGIAKEEYNKVFSSFEQTSSGIDKEIGTGLGLTISRNYAQKMDGDITFNSKTKEDIELLGLPRLKTGTNFYLRFKASFGKDNTFESKKDTIVGLATKEKGPKVLIVDDKPYNRDLIKEILTRIGFVTIEASDGFKAIDVFIDQEPDLILMDIRMPGMDGLEATSHIKATKKGTTTPIIVLTAGVFEEERKEIISNGADDFLIKPFKQQALLLVIGQHMNIKYKYDVSQNDLNDRDIIRCQNKLTKELFDKVPLSTILILNGYLLEGDRKSAFSVLEEVGSHSPKLINPLRDLINNYCYEVIIDKLKEFYFD